MAGLNLSNKVWQTVLGVLLASFLSMGAWVFSAVRDMPNKYVTRTEMSTTITLIENMDKKLTNIQTCVMEFPEKYPQKNDLEYRLQRIETKLDKIMSIINSE